MSIDSDNSGKKERVKTPSALRELTLGKLVDNLGSTSHPEQRYNNGYAHHQLAVFTSWIRAFEYRMAQFVSPINTKIREVVEVPSKDGSEVTHKYKPKDLIGKGYLIDRPIFDNTMTLTNWIENFYQESPSINARAREDQRVIGESGFKTAANSGFQPWGHEEEALTSD
jgi:hypothetical protein